MIKYPNTTMIKYPKTLHLPWSTEGRGDKKLLTDENFHGKLVVVTEKMDGENTTMYRDTIHARSLTYTRHESRDWVKAFWATIKNNIPDNWRVCGENLFATHSIPYERLRSYFYGFSIWDENNCCLPWFDTVEWFDLIGIESVPILYIGEYDRDLISKIWSRLSPAYHEGFVIRLLEGFHYDAFQNCVAKYVRPDHVQTDEHWLRKTVIPNKLSESAARSLKFGGTLKAK